MPKRIVVTGGSGKAGQHIISYLLNKGHTVLNLDLLPLPENISRGRVHTIRVDLSDIGQVYGALTSHFQPSEPFREPLGIVPDAVIHLAAYARNLIVTDSETFRCNVLSTYNIIEAACRLGIKKIIIASSICVYGVTFAEGVIDFPSYPVDENTDVNPMDCYAISKVCGERTARGFARRYGIDIYVFRIGAVIAPDEYSGSLFDGYVMRSSEYKVHGWSYSDARDLGQMCDLGIEKDGLGFQIFNATNDEITNYTTSTVDFLANETPSVPITRELGPREAPVSNKNLRDMLGFRQDHPWQLYYEQKHNS